MAFAEFMTYLMLFFAVLGCIDKAFGSQFGIGNWFEKALMSFGTLVLAMVGPMALAPFLSSLLAPVISPVCSFLRIDPSVTAEPLCFLISCSVFFKSLCENSEGKSVRTNTP